MKPPSITDAIRNLRPNAEFIIRGDVIEWSDETQTQPTDEEIQVELNRLTAEFPDKVAKANRASAYKFEADSLFFKAQRGEATMDEWNAKVAEIRARYPYGGES